MHSYLAERCPRIIGYVRWFDLPHGGGKDQGGDSSLIAPVRFCFLGFGSKAKGFDAFCEMAAESTKRYSSSRVVFECIGGRMRIPAGFEAFVRVPPSVGGMLSSGDYFQAISGIHYAVFPYRKEDYADRISAALLDAVLMGKPVICLRIPLFEHYFLEYPDIGYLCDSLDEMEKLVSRIASGPDWIAYGRQVQALSSFAGRFSVASAANRLVDVVEGRR